MIKQMLVALMLAGAISLVSASAIAQNGAGADPQGPPPGEEHRGGHHHFDPEKRTEMLTKQLKLTSDQQSKVLDIFKTEQSQMESLHSDSSLSQDDRHAKMMDIHKTSDDQIRALLDTKQQKKWDGMQKEHGPWEGHPPGGPGDGPPNDSH